MDKISDKCKSCVHFYHNGFCRYCKLGDDSCRYAEANPTEVSMEDIKVMLEDPEVKKMIDRLNELAVEIRELKQKCEELKAKKEMDESQ